MLLKLQKRTLVPSQIAGYTITLFIGIAIILTTLQLFLDARPLLYKDSNIFKSKSAVISKRISVFKSMNKEKIYFTQAEIKDLKNQIFTKDISIFTSASFKIRARAGESSSVPMFYTDLFFESVAQKYLDVETDEWNWDSSLDFIPIIIPEDYLNLYNFGFAESQGLPVLSKNMISQVEFNIQISGNQQSKTFRSKIVGFSDKINSILVPEEFLLWANKEFGNVPTSKTSRILIEFNDPSDEVILKYFNEKNYSIDKENLEFSKLIFFFKSALIFVFVIAIIIIVLSIAFILMSINLIIQKINELILNLYSIGYSHKRIAKFYQIVISSITVFSILIAVIVSISIRGLYLEKFETFFDFTESSNRILLFGFLLALLLIALYNVLLIRNIKRIVLPKKTIV
ncbi:MAG: ABC transporter permease [Flavobacteriaceae bacterium]|nr:ABC transporter permease [Flavobacteriaceae bacterium]